MFNWQKVLLWLMVLTMNISFLAMFSFSNCTYAAEGSPEEEWFIASSVMTLTFPWFIGVVEGMENVAEEQGNIDLFWQDAQFNISTQINQLENFAQMGVDGVIVYPTDGKAIIPTMKDLHEQGIKIVVADYAQDPDSPEDIVWETFVGHDFREMGRAAGRLAVKYLKTITDRDPVAVWLTSPPSGQTSIDRFEGFKEVVLAEIPNTRIIEEGNPEATRASAQSVFENLLQVEKTIDVVSGHNSDFVLGAYNAALEAGRDEIKFIGMAGYADVLKFIDEGNEMWLGEVLQDPVVLGETAMRAMIEALEGKELPEIYELPKPEIITYDNINSYNWREWAWLGLK